MKSGQVCVTGHEGSVPPGRGGEQCSVGKPRAIAVRMGAHLGVRDYSPQLKLGASRVFHPGTLAHVPLPVSLVSGPDFTERACSPQPVCPNPLSEMLRSRIKPVLSLRNFYHYRLDRIRPVYHTMWQRCGCDPTAPRSQPAPRATACIVYQLQHSHLFRNIVSFLGTLPCTG